MTNANDTATNNANIWHGARSLTINAGYGATDGNLGFQSNSSNNDKKNSSSTRRERVEPNGIKMDLKSKSSTSVDKIAF